MEEQQQIENSIIEEKGKSDILLHRYQKGKMLGKGGFAKCYEVMQLDTKRILAAKIIAKHTLKKGRTRQKLITEIKLHQSLHQVNIVQFEHVFEDHDNVYILLELCQNQTLNELLKRRRRLTQIEVQCYVNQLIGALKYIHNHRIIHRDLKLGNLFINDKMELKLGDFGLATKLDYDGQHRRTICGTPNYIAPEILDEKAGHSYEVDIWSLGVIIYTLLVGKPPFETSDVKTTYNKIKQCSFNFPDHISLSDNAKNLIQRILVLEPSNRLTLDEILAHPFMTSNQIPRTTHLSQLVSPPTAAWVSQFSQSCSQKIIPQIVKSQTLENITNKFTQADRITALNQSCNQSKNLFPEDTINCSEDIYVTKCCDYSNKYGIGYILSNHTAGILFNDSSCIFRKDQFYFQYIESNSKQEHKLNDYPSELDKKVKLLQKFNDYLGNDENQITKGSVYVHKFMKTKSALLLKLTNGTIQANFIDNTVLVILPTQDVYFQNEKGEKTRHSKQTIQEKETILRRYKYIMQLRSGCQQ